MRAQLEAAEPEAANEGVREELQQLRSELEQRDSTIARLEASLATVESGGDPSAARSNELDERTRLLDERAENLHRKRENQGQDVLPEAPGGPSAAAPLLGQHNDEVFGGILGVAEDELAELRRQEVL